MIQTVQRLGGMVKTNRFDGKDYKLTAATQLALLNDYKYERTSTKIELAPDRKSAVVQMRLVEHLVAPQGKFRVETRQASRYVMRKGNLAITAIIAESEITLPQ